MLKRIKSRLIHRWIGRNYTRYKHNRWLRVKKRLDWIMSQPDGLELLMDIIFHGGEKLTKLPDGGFQFWRRTMVRNNIGETNA